MKLNLTLLFCITIFTFFNINCDRPDENRVTDSLRVSFEVTDVNVYGKSTGEIIAHVYGGEQPYLIEWSNGSTDSIITGLAAGTYFIDVTDHMDSRISDSATVNQPDSLRLQLSKTNASGLNTEDGSVLLEIIGGVAPYAITWSTGDTSGNISNLSPGMYWVSVTDIYGAAAFDTVEITAEEGNFIKDADGNIYSTIRIGNQLWMRENLRITHAPNGDTIESFCYNDDTANARTYGRLYKWNVVMNGSVAESSRGICPGGWHMPSDEEWKELEMYLGMTRAEADMVNEWRGKGVGTKLAKGGSSGYDALYSGQRSSTGRYSLLDEYEYVWTSTEYQPDANFAWRRCFRIYSDDSGRWNTFPKTYAFSARCIKDE